jgi:hypothetical protein
METPTAERSDPTPARYTSGADVTGYFAPLVTPTPGGRSRTHPGARSAGGACINYELENLATVPGDAR